MSAWARRLGRDRGARIDQAGPVRVRERDLHRRVEVAIAGVTGPAVVGRARVVRVVRTREVRHRSPGSRPEAVDQTRGWFYTLLAISTLLFKQNSYRNVICLGHVVDPKGKKASKPKPSRQEEALRIIKEYATDLREILKKLRGKLN